MVYASIHVMRDAKGKTVQDMFPMLFDEDDDDDEPYFPISDEEVAQLQEEMSALNASGNPFA